ncbi:SDR family oxidoreductase [Paracoccus sp. S1E-3]|uniref:SDR family oxidoreductase n=1 Tax=Paracoccus sp. S1E-3 TaxID=2756130 RepID=UPI0015EFB242|nr:SDR family oxidoreductase [Paracoccus sp. S1E-3]MBA4492297.1 SDR family oxidoreductase [Paracoccus sp. S1E-3]
MHMLIFGHGYTAAALTPQLVAAGWTVSGTTRADAARVAAAGARPILWPGNEALLRDEISRTDAILIAAAPDIASGDPVLAAFSEDLLRSRAGWIGYLSSTNVYGDRGGDWVDESTQPRPTTARGQARLRAENDWVELARRADLPLTIFRLAGIYGPGRGPFTKLRNGTARRIVKPGQVFSRIHVDDIAGAILASLDRTAADEGHPAATTQIYNLCDDAPSAPELTIETAARLLGLPVPPAEPFAQAAMTPMARSFYAESKKVRNARLKQDLRYRLHYPDLEAGLRAIFAAEEGPI